MPLSRVVCTWLKIVGLQSKRFSSVIPSHPCITCLTHCYFHTSLFLHLHLVRPPLLTFLSLFFPAMSPSTATLQGGECFGRFEEQSPLTGCEHKSLIEVSSEHTPNILPSRKGCLDTNIDDLATTLDASEVYDTTDVGRLTSQLFSQEREVSADPFGVSCSQTHSSMEKSKREVEPFSSFGKPKKSRFRRVCRILKWKGKEYCPTKRQSRLPCKES